MATGALTTFAHTQLPDTTPGTLVSAIGAGTAAYINNIKLYNNNSTDETWVLSVNDGSNTYKVEGGVLEAGGYAQPAPINLTEGESILGVTTTAAKVTFRAVGILETI